MNAFGTYNQGDVSRSAVFTGVDNPVAIADSNCNGWTAPAGAKGKVGDALNIGTDFFFVGYATDCIVVASIYRLED